MDIWISPGGSWGVPPAWDPATRIAVAAVAAVRIECPRVTGSALCDVEALNSGQIKGIWQTIF